MVQKIAVPFFAALLLRAAPCLAFQLGVSATGGGAWIDGVYRVAVGDSISFSCVPSGGVGPYAYRWHFDDVDTYKAGPATAQNPSHAFQHLGEHRVWVSVVDSGDGDRVEKALLRVDVRLHDSTSTIDVTRDCGAHNLDGTGSGNVGEDLVACISESYDAVSGLRLYFPAGTYRFDDRAAGDYRVGLVLAWPKLAFIGDGPDRTTLSFFNDSDDTTKTHGDFFRAGVSTPSWWLWKRMRLQLDYSAQGDTQDDFARRQFLVSNTDDNSIARRTMFEDVDISQFSAVVGWGSFLTMKRANISQFGRGDDDDDLNDDWSAAVDYGDNSLIRWTHWADGAQGENPPLGHSHIFYPQNAQYTYVVENFADMSTAAAGAGKVVAQLKKAMSDSEFSGNLAMNCDASWGVKWGHADYTAERLATNDNRFQNISGKPIEYINVLEGEARRNFSQRSGRMGLSCDNGSGACDNSSNCRTDQIAVADNEYGYDDDYTSWSQRTDSCSITNVAETGNASTTNRYSGDDPPGWRDTAGYVAPSPFEFVAPVNRGDSAVDVGSGMEPSARFPFREGALAQGMSADGSVFGEVVEYAERASVQQEWIRYADRDHNWSLPAPHDGLRDDGSGVGDGDRDGWNGRDGGADSHVDGQRGDGGQTSGDALGRADSTLGGEPSTGAAPGSAIASGGCACGAGNGLAFPMGGLLLLVAACGRRARCLLVGSGRVGRRKRSHAGHRHS